MKSKSTKINMISVIIPVYNVEEYLDECVSSVVSQTYRDLEIILVDDGSPDRCPDMCDTWAGKDKRIKVIHKKNGGLSDARNVGLEVANGEYVAFVDSDDYIELSMYATLIGYMENSRTAFVMCPINRVKGQSTTAYSHNFDAYDDKQCITIPQFLEAISIGKNDFNTAYNKLYRREFLTQRFTVGRNNEDFLFFYWLCKEHYSSDYNVSICKTPLYNYREREGSICKQKKGSVNNFYFDIIQNNREIIADLSLWNKDLVYYIERRQEDALVKAMDIMIHFPDIVDKRHDDCQKAKEEFLKLNPWKPLNKKLSYSVNIFLMQYMPFIWKVYRKIKGEL